ncbi:MAG: hypothetical protein EBZ89_00325 [Chloroflexi bacterium]|nr:hypothetical protein [Chloroflexota bacterium]
MIVMAVAVPLVSPYGIAETRSGERLREPEFAHPFGTDRLGRDQSPPQLHAPATVSSGGGSREPTLTGSGGFLCFSGYRIGGTSPLCLGGMGISPTQTW